MSRETAPAAERAAWGDKPAPRKMKLLNWRSLRKGSLLGFASVELPIGLTIVDCPVCASGGRVWAALPAKPQIDRDGRPIVKDGRAQYTTILKWADRDLGDRFSEAIIALIRAEHPGAIEP